MNHKRIYKLCAAADAPWGPVAEEQEAGSSSQPIMWTINAHLPEHLPIIRLALAMSAVDVKNIGSAAWAEVDWQAVATTLGQPDQATLLKDVATQTMWRRAMEKHVEQQVQFGCAQSNSGGEFLGPLGDHLVLATCNLVARNQRLDVNRFAPSAAGQPPAGPSPADPPQANRRPTAPQERARAQAVLEVSTAIKALREVYISFLASKLLPKEAW